MVNADSIYSTLYATLSGATKESEYINTVSNVVHWSLACASEYTVFILLSANSADDSDIRPLLRRDTDYSGIQAPLAPESDTEVATISFDRVTLPHVTALQIQDVRWFYSDSNGPQRYPAENPRMLKIPLDPARSSPRKLDLRVSFNDAISLRYDLQSRSAEPCVGISVTLDRVNTLLVLKQHNIEADFVKCDQACKDFALRLSFVKKKGFSRKLVETPFLEIRLADDGTHYIWQEAWMAAWRFTFRTMAVQRLVQAT